MNRPITDYRRALDSKPEWRFKSVRGERLRTRRRPGDVEIVRDPRDGKHKRFRYGHGFEEAMER